MSWTDERIGVLKKMWKEGKSAAEIAKTLGKGVTRNAVIGKAHRMGLSGRPSPIKKQATAKKGKPVAAPKKATKATRKKETPPPAIRPSGKSGPTPPRDIDTSGKGDMNIEPLNGGVSLLDLTERMCKWPLGDPREADFIFCGRGIRQGTPYCPDHAAMAYQSSSRRGQAAAAAAAAANDKKKKAADAAEAAEAEDDVDVDVDVDDVDDVDDDDDDAAAEVTKA